MRRWDGTCVSEDGELVKRGWTAMESTKQTRFKEQLVRNSQVQMEKIHSL